jgi:hypothetical protein
MDAVLYALVGFAWVCLLAAVFVALAKFLAPRILGRDDGSSTGQDG